MLRYVPSRSTRLSNISEAMNLMRSSDDGSAQCRSSTTTRIGRTAPESVDEIEHRPAHAELGRLRVGRWWRHVVGEELLHLRDDLRQLGGAAAHRRAELVGRERRQQLLDDQGPRPERRHPLAVEATAGDDRHASTGGLVAHLLDQPRLADPRLPPEQGDAAAPGAGAVEVSLEDRELVVSARQRHAVRDDRTGGRGGG